MKKLKMIIALLICVTSFNALAIIDFHSEKYKKLAEEYKELIRKEMDANPENIKGPHWFKALEKCSEDGNFLCSFELGQYYYFLYDYKTAYKYLLATILKEPDHLTANRLLADIYEERANELEKEYRLRGSKRTQDEARKNNK